MADDQGPHRPGGFGLGLYVAKEIVVAHGGESSAESEPGAGSTFTVLLPRTSGAVGP